MAEPTEVSLPYIAVGGPVDTYGFPDATYFRVENGTLFIHKGPQVIAAFGAGGWSVVTEKNASFLRATKDTDL